MEQFDVKTLVPLSAGGVDVSYTNSSLWMTFALAAVAVFLFVGSANPRLVPGRWQAAVEYFYDFVGKMLDENVGVEGRRYVPLIFSIFIFVLACNLLGLLPFVGAFTPTSHIGVTFGLALIVFFVVLIGFAQAHAMIFSFGVANYRSFETTTYTRCCCCALSLLDDSYCLAVKPPYILRSLNPYILMSLCPYVLRCAPHTATTALGTRCCARCWATSTSTSSTPPTRA